MKLLRNFFVSMGASLLAFLAMMLLAACETTGGGSALTATDALNRAGTPPSTNLTAALPESADGQKIRISEQLTIELLDITPTQKIEKTVGDDGYITLPLLPQPIKAAGLTGTELQNEIQHQYVPRYYKRLTVNIKRENRYFWVKGEVRKPGQLIYTGDVTLLRAIAAAGDFTEYANRKAVEIIRANGKTEKVNAEKALKDPRKHDVPIYPGDTINVRQRWI